MLRLTKKADYGLMALKFLAERPDMPSLSAKDIAEAYGIPPQLLAKILQRLTKAGLLRSHAGTNGGYALSRPPEKITAFEVTSCETGPHACDLTDSCTIREPLRKVNQSIGDVLKAIRVSDLCEPEPGRKYHGRPMESILVSLGG
jgi:Rrf2 family protein